MGRNNYRTVKELYSTKINDCGYKPVLLLAVGTATLSVGIWHDTP